MDVLRRIVVVSVLAGAVAGLLVTALHSVGTARLIQQAEVFEHAADRSVASMASMPGMSEEAPAWEPANGLERTAFTALADVLTAIGFALLLVAAYAIRGQPVGWREGLYWGLAGFTVFALGPGLGLPPEVPGTLSAPLMDRQVWWAATALATAGGLALLFLGRGAPAAALGVLLLALPHVYGAPQPDHYQSAAPEFLAHRFIAIAAVTSLLFWASLGSLTGFFYSRFSPRT